MKRRNFLSAGAGLILLGTMGRISLAEGNSTLTEAEIAEILKLHNAAREEVGVGPLSWSEDLVAAAQKWCDHLVETDTFDHEFGDYGENLAIGDTAAQMFAGWMAEKALYNEEAISKSNTHKVGHYTQIVWADTKSVGVAKGKNQHGTVWVAYYDPPGNMRGEKPY